MQLRIERTLADGGEDRRIEAPQRKDKPHRNSVQHARATRIVIALRHLGARVQLRIRDNGAGFAVGRGSEKGAGFARMEERMRKIGGRLNAQSTVGRGTCLTADVYLEPILAIV